MDGLDTNPALVAAMIVRVGKVQQAASYTCVQSRWWVYQLAGDQEWDSGVGCRIPIITNDLAVCMKVCRDPPMLSCDTKLMYG